MGVVVGVLWMKQSGWFDKSGHHHASGFGFMHVQICRGSQALVVNAIFLDVLAGKQQCSHPSMVHTVACMLLLHDAQMHAPSMRHRLEEG
jgi:hypothetical protein